MGKEIGVGFLGALDFIICALIGQRKVLNRKCYLIYVSIFSTFKSHSGFHRKNGFGEGKCGIQDFPGGSKGKEFACKGGDGFDTWVGKIPWTREWLSTPVFLPGELYGQRSLVSCSPWGHKELDTTE